MSARNLWRGLALLMVVALALAACQTTPAPAGTEEPEAPPVETGGFQIPEIEEGKFNVAMVLIGPHDDGGWSEAHWDGLNYVADNVEGTHVAYIELVPEGADSEQVFRSLARKGFDLIIGTSFGYMDPMEIVATEFPDQMFIHLTGFKTNGTNYGNMFGEMEVFKYLAGMLAGSRAKTDGNPRLGYMATFPIPEELRLGNAIMLGAKRTCPECTMDVRWINTWHDPVIEKEGAESLFDAGVQVVFTGADTPAAGDVATQLGDVWGVNYDHVNACQTERCLTAPYWTWGPIYAAIAQGTMDGSYTPGFQYFDSSEGGMGLFGFMPGQTPQPGVADLPAEDVQLVMDTLAAALAGEFDRFDVFAGPIYDNQGNLIVPEGATLEQLDLDGFAEFGSPCETCMYWWADGITAELPDL
ncbi:MAG TPA: BMP family ABC transporter substrate-binding protein [Anaerolineales bacterium]|nr:BMP family ABC transporter substrate-binding protein [Anaerolineales bacterium]